MVVTIQNTHINRKTSLNMIKISKEKLVNYPKHSLSTLKGEHRLFSGNEDGKQVNLLLNQNHPNHFFIQFDNEPFIELNGSSSAVRGNSASYKLTTPLSDYLKNSSDGKYRPSKVDIKITGTQGLVDFDSSHVFLNEVDIPEIFYEGVYIPTPPFKEIMYAFYVPDCKKGLIVTCEQFKFSYDTLELYFYSKEIHKPKIENFQRYRDGGTTLFDFNLNDTEYKFYTPSSLGGTNKKSTLNGFEMIPMVNSDIRKFITRTNLLMIDKTQYE